MERLILPEGALMKERIQRELSAESQALGEGVAAAKQLKRAYDDAVLGPWLARVEERGESAIVAEDSPTYGKRPAPPPKG